MDVEVAIVNYATPELTTRAVWSLRSLYPDLPIRVLENGSPDDSGARLEALAREVEPFDLVVSESNLHHGPGLDRLIRTSTARWVLLFDSDCLAFRQGFIERMLEQGEVVGAYMIGQLLAIDAFGYKPDDPDESTYPYIHPHCALLRRETYHDLPPFEKHGVPCLTNEREALGRGEVLLEFPVGEYVYHLGRGTVTQHGYRLGPVGWWYQLRHYARRLFD